MTDPEDKIQHVGIVAFNSFSNLKKGWRVIGGKRYYYKSLWEANYARFLQYYKETGVIAEWEYEPETFWFKKILRGVRSYKPDFRIKLNTGNLEYHEIKGYLDKKSKTKMKRMAKYYPDIKLRLVEEDWFKENNPKYKGIISDWE